MHTTREPAGIDRAEICAAVAEQLGIDGSAIAGDDDLIELGLDSLRTMKLAGRWRKQGIAVNFAQLAAEPTVEAWYRLLAEGRTESARPPAADGETATDSDNGPESDAPFALAPMQHAYWIGRFEGQELGSVAAHLYVEFDGTGVHPDRLHNAVEQLPARHPMLRTRFLPDGSQQTTSRPGREIWSLTDLRTAQSAEVERTLDTLREQRTHQRLAVEEGQVIDIALTLLPDNRTRLHLDVDMLAADAASYRLLISDLARLYHGESLPSPSYTFREYLAEQPAGGPEHEADRQWWHQRLPELPGAPDLPHAPVTGGERRARTARHHHWLAPTTKDRIFAESHSRRVTPAMVLASVFAETIGGWSANRRFLLNLPLFHREPVHPDVDSVVGDFTSSVLLEVDLTAPATVSERAHALQQELHAAGAHSAYSGLEVLRDLGRLRGEPVLAPIVYTSAINLGELFADRVTETFGDPAWIVSQGPQVLLDAQVTEVQGGLLLNWDVRADAFPPGMIETMFHRYIASVTALAGDSPESSGGFGWDAVATMDLPPEQAVVRQRVNATSGPESGRALHTAIFEQAVAQPEAAAVIWETDEPADNGDKPHQTRILTYGEVAGQALAIGGALQAAGIGPGDAVAIQLPKGPDQILAAVGVLAAGATYVPIGIDQPAARRREILRTGDIRAALTDGMTIPEVPTLALPEAKTHPQPLTGPASPEPEAIAYVLFTSGSTGQPKGVEVPHRAAVNTVEDLNERFGLGPADRVLALSALEFDLSVYDIFGLFAAGGAVVTVSPVQREDPARWVELIRRQRVSVLNCVPSLLDMVLTAASGTMLDSLRTVLVGGDWVDVALPRRLAAVAPKCRFAGLGGATETAIHSTICEVVEARMPEDWAAVPYGTPLRNVQCRVVAPSGSDCPDWVSGELWIGGTGVAAGYRGDTERTADRFVVHGGLRWYRTGDLARYRPDGTLEFLGRADHQVKIRGYRVELGEVESALRAQPGVRHATAAVTGPTAPKLAAVVVPIEGADLDVETLRSAVAELIPGYMIPSRIELMPELPLTPNGKPDRKAMVELLESNDSAGLSVGARTDVERALVDIVATVLECDRVGVTDDFFALGGDSVLATTVVAQVRELLDTPDAVVADFLRTGTVSGLAQRLLDREARSGNTGRLEAVAQIYLTVAGMSDAEVLEEA